MTTEKVASGLFFSISVAAMKAPNVSLQVAATGAAVWPSVVLGCVAILAVALVIIGVTVLNNKMKTKQE